MKLNNLLLLSIITSILGCATQHKVVLDSSPNRPGWTKNNKVTWEDDGKIFIKSSHSIRGDERLNACYDLAQLDAKEKLLSEMANDIKGSLDNASQSISESAEVILTKVRTGEFEGRVTGLRFTEQFFERYKIEDKERVDCSTLAEISMSDYSKNKELVINKITKIDPKLKEAITQKNIDFFNRKPASSPEN